MTVSLSKLKSVSQNKPLLLKLMLLIILQILAEIFLGDYELQKYTFVSGALLRRNTSMEPVWEEDGPI